MSSRLLLALAFALLFAALPRPGDQGGPYLGYLSVRQWLLDRENSPLLALRDQAWQLRLDLLQSPQPAQPADEQRYLDLARECQSDRFQTTNPAWQLPLWVRVGTFGVQASLTLPDGTTASLQQPLPSRLALLPAALAVLIAILTLRVFPALLAAGLAGSFAWAFSRLQPEGLLASCASALRHLLVDCLWHRAIGQDFYLRITLFVALLFAAVAIVQAGDGFRALVDRLQRYARGPVGAQCATFLTGLVLMFDDYTSCLVTGAAMQPLCDRNGVPRCKLAYLVDATAAPVAGVSIASTWVAYETSQYRAPLAMVTRDDGTAYQSSDAFAVFLASMPYRFYCWFSLLLALLSICMRRELFAMATARPVPLAGSASQPNSASRAALALGIVPLLAVVVVACTQIALGRPSDLALLSAGAAMLSLAVLLGRGSGLPWRRMLLAVRAALRSLLPPLGVLFCAWTLGHVTNDLGTSHYLAAAAREFLHPTALPIVLFLLAALIAFATGTSFGTMAILLPNVVLLAKELAHSGAFVGGGDLLLLLSLAAVLEGAIFGDHASPISDTTLLSAMSSGCRPAEHFVTQLPYALVALLVTVLCGYLPMLGLGPGWYWAGLVVGGLVLALVLLLLGKRPIRPLAHQGG